MTLMSELGMRKGFDNPPYEALLSIYYTAARLRKRAGEFFRQYGLTDVQFNVLSLLKHESGESGGLTQVELSRMMLVNRANITTLIDRMEKAKLVERRSAPDDRRYNIIHLTEHGDEMFHNVAEVYGGKVADIMSVLGDDKLNVLIDGLQEIRDHLDEVELKRP